MIKPMDDPFPLYIEYLICENGIFEELKNMCCKRS